MRHLQLIEHLWKLKIKDLSFGIITRTSLVSSCARVWLWYINIFFIALLFIFGRVKEKEKNRGGQGLRVNNKALSLVGIQHLNFRPAAQMFANTREFSMKPSKHHYALWLFPERSPTVCSHLLCNIPSWSWLRLIPSSSNFKKLWKHVSVPQHAVYLVVQQCARKERKGSRVVHWEHGNVTRVLCSNMLLDRPYSVLHSDIKEQFIPSVG